jgi:DNA-binding Lrp family transcriptional regulator
MNEIKLDLKDKKILYELDLDSRQSCSKIAKKVGLSTEVVNYRIKRLEEEQIITQYQIIINLAKLGIIQFKICLSLQHLPSTQLNSLIEQLKKKEEIKWIVSCRGDWDLIISLEARSIYEMEMLKEEVLSLFSGNINKKAVSMLIEAETSNRGYLLDKKPTSKRIILQQEKAIELDSLDISILKELSNNARIPLIDISHRLKKSPRVINYRIKQLQKNKIILGFKIAINYEKLGIKFHKLFIYLDSPNKKKIEDIENYISTNKNSITQVKVLGNWDIEPEFETFSDEDFENLLIEIKDKFSEIISKIDIITISKEHKFVYF